MNEELLLGGPIVRRATRSRVCVWVATSRDVVLQLVVLDGAGGPPLAASDPADLMRQQCRLGTGLRAYLLEAARPDGFPLDQLLFYRVEVIGGDGRGTPFDFRQMGLTYGDDQHPSVFIPSKVSRLLYGSCRKPHGTEERSGSATVGDRLAIGDSILARTHRDLAERPALLMLIGDQIYADDVPDSILAMIEAQASGLVGKETLPRPDDGEDESRAAFVRATGFSSRAANNHLLRFGEYAAMYLYVLGNAGGWQPQLEGESFARQAALAEFHRTLPLVRRLLANVSTYMIFDDHDVTDDWNITGGWSRRVRDSALGRRVVANALAAYWAFQGWGNDPDNFDKDLRIGIERRLQSSLDVEDSAANRYFERRLWGRIKWGYSIPTQPPIIVLDTRTQRHSDEMFSPSQLLDRQALDWLHDEWLALTTRTEMALGAGSDVSPIFVAPTPVMGFRPIERFQGFVQRVFAWLSHLFGRPDLRLEGSIELLDIESWIANRRGFSAFLCELLTELKIESCMFLSGDVHYSYTATARFSIDDKQLHVLQCTSSALSNLPHDRGMLARVAELGGWRGEYERRRSSDGPLPWAAEMTFQRLQGGNFLTNSCTLGMVQLRDGKPTGHRLWHTAETFDHTDVPSLDKWLAQREPPRPHSGSVGTPNTT